MIRRLKEVYLKIISLSPFFFRSVSPLKERGFFFLWGFKISGIRGKGSVSSRSVEFDKYAGWVDGWMFMFWRERFLGRLRYLGGEGFDLRCLRKSLFIERFVIEVIGKTNVSSFY